MLSTFLAWLTKGPLDRILTSVDNSIDNGTERERIRSKAIEKHIEVNAETRQAQMQSKYFWYIWMLFSAPLGIWWALIMIDTFLTFIKLDIPPFPPSLDAWAEQIFYSIFGSGGSVATAQAISSAIRGRK